MANLNLSLRRALLEKPWCSVIDLDDVVYSIFDLIDLADDYCVLDKPVQYVGVRFIIDSEGGEWVEHRACNGVKKS